jgi:alkylated DNA nucleotide flippase Atl1
VLPKTSLRDILDVEAFVIDCIKRSGAPVQPHEYEDLVAEGICILYAMERKYIPKMAGYTQEGRFSGYAIKWMPRKMKEAWHRMHEECTLQTMPDKTRRWVRRERAQSWDALQDQAANGGFVNESTIRTPGSFVAIPVREE